MGGDSSPYHPGRDEKEQRCVATGTVRTLDTRARVLVRGFWRFLACLFDFYRLLTPVETNTELFEEGVLRKESVYGRRIHKARFDFDRLAYAFESKPQSLVPNRYRVAGDPHRAAFSFEARDPQQHGNQGMKKCYIGAGVDQGQHRFATRPKDN
jgi:hypothetical protein